MTLVVDTSVIIKWFVSEDGHDEAIQLLESSENLACPDLAFAETANVLWRKVRLEQVTLDQAKLALDKAPGFFDEVISCAELTSDAFALAQVIDHSVYDCVFLAAAMRHPEDVLFTDDRKFAQKCVNAGFAEKIRMLRNEPLILDMSDLDMSELIDLVEKSDQITESVTTALKGSSDTANRPTLNIKDLGPAIDSPINSKLMQKIGALTRDQARTILAICWYGVEITSQGFEQDFKNAVHLAQDPEKHAGYISGYLKFYEIGLRKLRSSHPQFFPENGD